MRQQLWGRAQWAGPESVLLCLGWGGRGAGSHGATISQLLAASSGTTEHSWSVFRRGGQDWHLCQWCWCAPRGGSAAMQPQCPPQGVMCPPNCGSNHPHVSGTLGYVGNQRRFLLGPHLPQGTCGFMHTLPTAPAALFVCWCFISHFLFSFKPTYCAVCGCFVPVCPHSWPGSPLGFWRRQHAEVSVLLLSCVTVKALTHNCSVNHPGSIWRSISCICVFNCLLSVHPDPSCEGWLPVCSLQALPIPQEPLSQQPQGPASSKCKCRAVFLLGFK